MNVYTRSQCFYESEIRHKLLKVSILNWIPFIPNHLKERWTNDALNRISDDAFGYFIQESLQDDRWWGKIEIRWDKKPAKDIDVPSIVDIELNKYPRFKPYRQVIINKVMNLKPSHTAVE